MAHEHHTPELVMPAGTLEKLQFACAYGADAVYAGLPKFSLRARTNTFTEAELAEGIAYAHELGIRVYLTLNIFARNSRIEASMQALRASMPFAPDAVILSDPGLILLVRQAFPDLELHLSTQANTLNWAAVQFWRAQGISRVILPRELSIPEIQEIHVRVPEIDLEVFVHGAMCIAYAGRCLLSSYLAHRDANLGVCTNSCRWPYRLWQKNSHPGRGQGWVSEEYALEQVDRPGEFFPIDEDEQGAYILNSKDLCGIEQLRELKDAGVAGVKIEGRTKSVYYLAHIGRAYRKAIDDLNAGKPFDAAVFNDIHATASRGLTPGFLRPLPDEARQNYTLGTSEYATHQFGGIVRRYDQETGLAEIEVKNRLELGDTLELVSPHDVFVQPVRAMRDLAEQPISVAHPGAANVWLKTDHAVEPLTLLRRRMHAECKF